MGEAAQTSAAVGGYSNSVGATNRLQGPAAPINAPTNYLGMGSAAISGGATAYAQYSAGQANKRIAMGNARIAREQAAQAEQSGQFAANRVYEHERQIEGSMKASAASSGIVAGAGTSGRAAASSAAASDMDRYLIQLNARRQAYGFQTKAAIDTFEGNLAARKGEQEAIGTLGHTAAKVALLGDEQYGGYQHDRLTFDRGE